MLFPMEYITALNVILVICILLFIYSGYRQGFLLKIFGCIGFLFSGFFAWFLSYPLSKILIIYPESWTPLQGSIVDSFFYLYMNRIFIFILLLIVFGIVVLFLKPILKCLQKIPVIGSVNRLLGACFGALQGFACLILVTIIFSTPFFANGSKVIEESYLQPIAKVNDVLLFFATDTFQQLKSLQKIVTPSTTLTQQDFEAIYQWMQDSDLTDSQIFDFLKSLEG